MNDKEIQTLKNVLNNPEGAKLIYILLRKLGAFERGFNFQTSEKEIFKQLTKRDQGLWLLDNCYSADYTKTTELVKEWYRKE